jgi:signal transduction histidine kinase/ligand-binding sensor domain-containing protein
MAKTTICDVVWIICLATLSIAQQAVGVQPYVPKTADPLLDSWRWGRLSELEGKTPLSMAVDQHSTMWFGLNGAVASYDGRVWTTYDGSNVLGGAVSHLCCSRSGDIYATTPNGLCRLSHGAWERVFPGGTNTLALSCLTEAFDGTIWAGGGGVIFRMSSTNKVVICRSNISARELQILSGAETVLVSPNEIPGNLEAIHATHDGAIWLAFENGALVRLRMSQPPSRKEFTLQDGYHPGFSSAQFITETMDGKIWVGNGHANVGLSCFDPKTEAWTYFKMSELVGADDVVFSLTETPDGSVWLGGMSKLFRYFEGKWTMYRTPQVPLTTSEISELTFANGYFWILGDREGVQKVDITDWHWIKYEQLNFQCDTPDGKQWFISADDGVVSCDGKQWLRYGVEDGLMGWPCALICARNGQLWAAGGHTGVCATACLDTNGWQLQLHTNLPSVTLDFRAACETDDGSLWFSTYVDGGRIGDGGPVRYSPSLGPPKNPEAWSRGTPTNGAPSTSYGFAQLKGRLFSGSYLGLAEFDGKAWIQVPEMRGQRVDGLSTSPDGQLLWIATRNSGVFCYDGTSFRQYTTQDGVAANSVICVLGESEHRAWAMTGLGISRFDGTHWTSDLFPEQKLTSDGGRIKQGQSGAFWINQCSRSWMRRTLPGNKTGGDVMNSFSTMRYIPVRLAPETEIVTSLARVPQPGNTVISWQGADPWSQTQPRDLVFSYRLNDSSWSPFAKENHHIFLQLAKGKYKFEVRSRDRDFNVDPSPAHFEFVVLPPVWQEPWFISLMAVLLGLLVTQTTRVLRRDQKLAAKSALLEQKTDLLSREVDERKAAQAVVEQQRAELEKEIAESKRMQVEVERIHRELIDASRQAGQAEVASSILHNVGNVLNSVNVSTHIMWERLRKVHFSGITKVAQLICDHQADLGNFFKEDEKGRMLPQYLLSLGSQLVQEQTALLDEVKDLAEKIDHIKEIVAMQQNYAKASGVVETIVLPELIENALKMQGGAYERHGVALVQNIEDLPSISTDKHKVLQILVNILHNAKYACDDTNRKDKRVEIRAARSGVNRVKIEVADNGIGIAPENLTRIFAHGFTTRKKGHGYGLHSAALAAKELGGSLVAESSGPDTGATFILEIPIEKSA